MSIKCRKVGQTYLQLCDSKRDNYNEADVKDKDVLKILKNIKNVFPVATTIKPATVKDDPNAGTVKIKAVKSLKKVEPVVETPSTEEVSEQ